VGWCHAQTIWGKMVAYNIRPDQTSSVGPAGWHVNGTGALVSLTSIFVVFCMLISHASAKDQFFFQPCFLGCGRTRSALGAFQEGLEWIDRGEDGRW